MFFRFCKQNLDFSNFLLDSSSGLCDYYLRNLSGGIMDYLKLRGKIREVCKSEKAFAHELGISNATVSLKLNGKAQWNMSEVRKSCIILSIPYSEIDKYFFSSST